MMIPLWVALAALVVGVGGGGAGVLLIRGGSSGDAAPAVAAAADVAEATGEAATAVPLAEVELALALAQAPASRVVCEAAVEPDATARTVALCATLACWSHVEGAETSAGLGCLDRGRVLDGLLVAPR